VTSLLGAGESSSPSNTPAPWSGPNFHGGNYTEYPAHGIKAFWRAYSTWALSREWFRARAWDRLGYKTLLGYLGDV
jgi:hypothetical protein